MTYIIAEPCVGVKDKGCVEIRPLDGSHDDASWRTPLIDPEARIDCARRVDACPVEATFALDDVPSSSQRPDRQELGLGQPLAPRDGSFAFSHTAWNETGGAPVL